MSSEPKTFCKAPFRTAVVDTNGALLPCCEFMTNESKLEQFKLNGQQSYQFKKWWEEGLDKLRKKMLNGEIDSGCRYCFKKEQDGYNSLRQGINNKISESYEQIKKNYLENKRQYPEQIELRLGSYCNLKCIMCGPYASSSIMAEYKKHQKEYNKFGIVSNFHEPLMPKDWYSYDHNKSIMLELVSNAKRIHFGGGEPFISPILIEVLNCISPKTYLKFNTNMSKVNNVILDILKKFEQVDIDASIDGIGEHNNYLRHGSDWLKIENNFKKLKQCTNINLNINYILQHTSLFTLKEVVKFSQQNELKIVFGEVYNGSVDGSGHLTVNSATQKDVDKFRVWLDTTSFADRTIVQSWINSYVFNSQLHNRFKKYVIMLDGLRGTNFAKTFKPCWT